MQDHGSRLVGLDGVQVMGVREVRGQLDLEVELTARGLLPDLRARVA
jgi:hypothetical protein